MDFSLEVITKETAYPVLLAEAKEYLRIPGDSDEWDITLQKMIVAACSEFERKTGRALASRVLRLETKGVGRQIELPFPPLISLDTIECRDDTDDSWTAVDSADYYLDSARTPAMVVLENTPIYSRIEYTCGAADERTIDDDWNLTILQMIAFYHEHLGDDTGSRMPIALMGRIKGHSVGDGPGYWYF